jgi:hypothetical protein
MKVRAVPREKIRWTEKITEPVKVGSHSREHGEQNHQSPGTRKKAAR